MSDNPPPSASPPSNYSFYFGLFAVFAAVLGVACYYFIVPAINGSPPGSAGSAGSPGSAGNKTAEIYMFHVDWCPHCKTAMPEWEQFHARYNNETVNGYKFILQDVNCTEETPDVESMLSTYTIEGYPTVKMVRDGQVVDFNAKITMSNLSQFINS